MNRVFQHDQGLPLESYLADQAMTGAGLRNEQDLMSGRRMVLHRPRLVNRIGPPASMAMLTVLRAPVGYGKSALLHQWMKEFGNAASIANIGIESGHSGESLPAASGNVRNLTNHIESVLTGRISPSQQTLQEKADGEFPSDKPLVIIVDDAERLPAEGIRWLLNHLSSDLPYSGSIRVILSGRNRADLLVGAAAARGLVTNISHVDLAFTLPELAQLLGHSHGGTTHNLDGLLLETRGWPAGVRIFQGFTSAAEGAGLTPVIDSYVKTEILERLGPALRNVVLGFAFLPYITIDLISSLCPKEVDEQNAIIQLGHLMPSVWHYLPTGEQVYRLIPIVKASLRRIAKKLPDHPECAHHVRKAAAWFVEHGQIADAVHVGKTSGEWTVTLDELQEPCRILAGRDQHAELLEVFESIPLEHLHAFPDLTFWRLLALLSTGRQREAIRDLAIMKLWPLAIPAPLDEGRRLLIRALQSQAEADPDNSLEAATRALRVLPVTAHHERFRSLALVRDLQVAVASDAIIRATDADLQFERSLLDQEQRWWWSHCVPNQIDQRALTGNLDAAYDICLHQLRSMPQQSDTERLPLHARLAEIELERGDPEAALNHLAGIGSGLVRWRGCVSVELVHARVLHDLGQDAAAREIVYACIRLASSIGDFQSRRNAQAVLAQFWLDRGNTELAIAWSEEDFPDQTGRAGSFGAPLPALVYAELLVATQRPKMALTILNAVAQYRMQRGHGTHLVRCYALMAQAHWSLGEVGEVRTAIAEAIQIGARQRFRRSFMIGNSDARWLTSRTPPMEASGHKQATPSSILTGRELETIQLVASGLGNVEIASRLHISKFTVKNHLASIFGKLNVRNRRDAIRAAQSAGLI